MKTLYTISLILLFSSLFSQDAALTPYTVLVSGCGLGYEDLSVVLSNVGSSNLTNSGDIHCEVNGDHVSTTQVSQLAVGATGIIQLAEGFDFSIPGFYEVVVWVEYPDDVDNSNDTIVWMVESIDVLEAHAVYPEICPNMNTLPIEEDGYQGTYYFSHLNAWETINSVTGEINGLAEGEYQVTRVVEAPGCLKDSVMLDIMVSNDLLDTMWITATELRSNKYVLHLENQALSNTGSYYIIMRGTSAQTLQEIDTVEYDAIEWIDENMDPGVETYFYAVRTVKECNSSSFTTSVEQISFLHAPYININNPIDIYPNPTTVSVSIETGQDGEVRIIDMAGKVVLTAVVSRGVNIVSVSKLNRGQYFVKYQSNTDIVVKVLRVQ